MADQNALRTRLTTVNSYRQLTALRGEIVRSKGQLPFSIYADLLSRTDEKIRTFEYPMCATAKITLMFSNGLAKELSTEECLSALSMENTLSSYIFTKYPSTSDFKMDMIDLTGTMTKDAPQQKPEEPKDPWVPPQTSPKPEPVADKKIEEEVRDLSERVDKMEKTFNEELPKINRKMTDLEVKMDYLYFHVVKKDKKESDKE